MAAILRDLDAVVHLVGDDAAHLRATWGDADPRIVVGPPTADARSRITVVARTALSADERAWSALVADLDAESAGRIDVVHHGEVIVEIRSARADARARRHADALGVDAVTLAAELFPVLCRDAEAVHIVPSTEEPRLDW